ncbi:MAG TPA: tRNA-dihydrouridine synthase family protein, partial [Thermotogota bacterium]|nr:tRNA-dihydrouridine synthase family protein [Thermotogota bacterium]
SIWYNPKSDFPGKGWSPLQPSRPLIALAPMAGITDAPFRELVHLVSGGAADFLYTEMISARGICMQNRATLRMLPSPEEKRVLVQLFGEDPSDFEEAARLVFLNAPGAIGVDVNAACPVKKVIRNNGGASLARDIPRLRNILQALRPLTKSAGKKLSLKIRMGWQPSSDEGGTADPLPVLRLAEECGVDFVALHGRTVQQKYAGHADPSVLPGILNSLSLPLFWTGDIFSPEDALQVCKNYPVAGVLVARGSLGNPWFFEDFQRLWSGEIHEPPQHPPGQRMQVIRLHLDLLLKVFPPSKVAGQFKKFVAGYTHGLPHAREKRHWILQAQNLEELEHRLFSTLQGH